MDASYEDSDITEEELMLAKRRYRSALLYIIRSVMEDLQDEKNSNLLGQC